MKTIIDPRLYVDKTQYKGRGVFTRKNIPPRKTIETSSVLVMTAEERKLLDQTQLHDYIFVWGKDENECCVAWGYISLYNHSYSSNCEYFMDFDQQVIRIKTIREIKAGEELTINYNGNWDDNRPVWFDAL